MLLFGIFLILLSSVGFFIFYSLRECPATPPFYVAKKFFGNYAKDKHGKIKYWKGGLTFFPFYGFVSKEVLLDCSQQKFVVKVTDVRTSGDMVDCTVESEISWYIDVNNIGNFIEASGEIREKTPSENYKKIQEILEGMVAEAVRELAGKEGKPSTWQEAVGSNSEFVASILNKIGGENISEEDMKNLRRGKGKGFVVESLGIVIKRLNIIRIVPDSEIAKAAEALEKETREAMADSKEADNAVKIINKIAEETGLTKSQAANIFQSERGKASRQIIEISGEGGAQPIIFLNPEEKRSKK